LQIGFLRRTKRGREITAKACKHLGLKYHKEKQRDKQVDLFEQEES
jgi:hypothetical protein